MDRQTLESSVYVTFNSTKYSQTLAITGSLPGNTFAATRVHKTETRFLRESYKNNDGRIDNLLYKNNKYIFVTGRGGQ
jgi:hypothetical protein